MRVIYLHQFFVTPQQPGATRSYEMARRLVSFGHEVHMITSGAGWLKPLENAPRRRSWQESMIEGIHVHTYPVAYANKMGFSRRILAFLIFMVVSTFRTLSIKADVIYASSAPLTIAIPAMIASVLRRTPMVLEVRDLWPEAPIQMGALKNPLVRKAAQLLEKMAYARSRHVVGLSPGMRDGIVKVGKRPEDVSVIPNSSDLDRFSPEVDGDAVRADLGLQGRFILSYMGALGMANGLDYVLDAAAELKRRGNTLITFLIVGEGKTRPTLEARIRDEGLDNVLLRPPVPKSLVPHYMAASDVCLTIFKDVPILRTCSPNKMFDALAAGRPVLTNMPGWLGDIAEIDRTGALVDPTNPISLADKAEYLSTHPDFLAECRINARTVAETRFDRDVLARKLDAVLRAAAGVHETKQERQTHG